MKTFKNIYPRIYDFDNLWLAAKKARKRKTRKIYVEDFDLHRERFLRNIQEDLINETYTPSGYKQFYIYEPKKRLISAAPYRDRIVHHALCNIIGPLTERRFIYDSYSCRVGKGTSAARDRCRKYTNHYKYALKCDIKKFFQNIDHDRLILKITRVIGCGTTLNLCRKIIDSQHDETETYEYFDGDDFLSVAARKKGLPIGNLTSQLWANLYLDAMDHYIKEDLRVPGYTRYTDDFILWADDKSFLNECRVNIEMFLQKDRMKFNQKKTQVMPTKSGVPFLGFRFKPGLAPRLAGDVKRRFEKRTRLQFKLLSENKITLESLEKSVFGWSQYGLYGNVKGLFLKYRQLGFGQTGI